MENQDDDIIEVEIGEHRFEPLKQSHEEQLIKLDKEHINKERKPNKEKLPQKRKTEVNTLGKEAAILCSKVTAKELLLLQVTNEFKGAIKEGENSN